MKYVTSLAAALPLLLAAGRLSADEVVLKNGSVFSGIVREDGERVVLEVDYGTMTFKKADVRSVSRGEDAIREFEKRSAAATDVKAMMDLASWARDKGLAARMNELYRKVLRLDPDQAEARKALGFEKVNGVWLEGDDLMVAKGFVKINGRWLTKETARQILAQEAQGRAESDRLATAVRAADQEHEREMTRIALAREQLVAEERGDLGWSFPCFVGPWTGAPLLPQALAPAPPMTFGPVLPPAWTAAPSFTTAPLVPSVRRR